MVTNVAQVTIKAVYRWVGVRMGFCVHAPVCVCVWVEVGGWALVLSTNGA